MGPNKTISIRPSDEFLTEIAARGEPTGSTIQAQCERYFYALNVALGTVSLTQGEACLILDVTNGTLWESWSIGMLWASVADGIRLDGLDTKWEIDGPALVAKIQSWDYWQTLAVVDAAERWWRQEPERRQLSEAESWFKPTRGKHLEPA